MRQSWHEREYFVQDGRVERRLRSSDTRGFSHSEYRLGLTLTHTGIADDVVTQPIPTANGHVDSLDDPALVSMSTKISSAVIR